MTRHCSLKLHVAYKNCFYFDIQNNICTQHDVNLYFSWNSMNNLSSYCGLTESRMRASDTDLPVVFPRPRDAVIWPHCLGLNVFTTTTVSTICRNSWESWLIICEVQQTQRQCYSHKNKTESLYLLKGQYIFQLSSNFNLQPSVQADPPSLSPSCFGLFEIPAMQLSHCQAGPAYIQPVKKSIIFM